MTDTYLQAYLNEHREVDAWLNCDPSNLIIAKLVAEALQQAHDTYFELGTVKTVDTEGTI